MASLTIAAGTNVAASASALAGARISSSSRKPAVCVNMAPVRSQAATESDVMQRRAMFVAAAVSAVTLMSSNSAKAEKEPKKGSKEAKKKYANICVSLPTASVCNG